MLRLPFLRRAKPEPAESNRRDMRFFLHDLANTDQPASVALNTDAVTRTAASNAAAVQAGDVVAPAVTHTHHAPSIRLIEREPPTVRMQVPQGFANMESAIAFTLAYERGMANVAKLKLIDDDFKAGSTSINNQGKQSGYNPYESGLLARDKQPERSKKPTDLRALSKWIEQTRKQPKLV